MNTLKEEATTPLQAAAIALGEYVGFADYDEHGEHVYTGEARTTVAAFLKAFDMRGRAESYDEEHRVGAFLLASDLAIGLAESTERGGV